MILTAIKNYPSQISTAFKRFPLAVAFAIFTTIAFIYVFEGHGSLHYSKLTYWLSIYPIAATMIAITISLVQESRKKFSAIPHVVAGVSWFVISIALVFCRCSTDSHIDPAYVKATLKFIYTTIFLSLFIAPFFKQKDENGFWVFLMKNAKAAVIAIAISVVLLAAIEGLLFGFFNLFDIEVSDSPFVYSAITSLFTIFPILFFSGIPSIDECLQEAPALNKFQISANKFLFLPVLLLYIFLLDAYIAKIIIQWEMPKGMVSYLVSASMMLMLLRVTLMLPERINPKPSFEKKLLKILPTACIPLVILMSVGILRRISDYGISEDRYYIAAINIFYYVIIAILLIDKIKCKSRVIAIVFCSMFFILTNGPLSAINVTHRVWMDSIKTALVEQGYNKFPLSKEDTQKFIEQLKTNKSHQSKIALSRIQEIGIGYKDNNLTRDLAQYINKGSAYGQISKIKFEKNAPIINKNIVNNSVFDIPQNATKANHFYRKFSKKEYEFRNDTLFFKFQFYEKTYDFFITKQALEQEDVKTFKAKGVQINVETLDIKIRKNPEGDNFFQMNGIIFLE